MGREAVCTARFGGKSGAGKALLETREVVFRSPELRLHIPFERIQRIEVKNGEKASITLTPRPVIALLATAGAADAAAATKTGLIAASSDLRAAAERALAKTANVLIHAPAAADVRKFETDERAPSGWLAFDLARKPLTPGARQVTAEARRDLSARLSKAMNVQGVAALVTPPNANANDTHTTDQTSDSRHETTWARRCTTPRSNMSRQTTNAVKPTYAHQ